MIKVVYNDCYGGFGVSEKAFQKLKDLGVDYKDSYSVWNIPRHDPRFVQVVEELGKEASSMYANLKVTTIEGNKYRIDEYDGMETVIEPDDIRWIVVE